MKMIQLEAWMEKTRVIRALNPRDPQGILKDASETVIVEDLTPIVVPYFAGLIDEPLYDEDTYKEEVEYAIRHDERVLSINSHGDEEHVEGLIFLEAE